MSLSKGVGVETGVTPSFALPVFGLKELDSELVASRTVFSGLLQIIEGFFMALRTLLVLHCSL